MRLAQVMFKYFKCLKIYPDLSGFENLKGLCLDENYGSDERITNFYQGLMKFQSELFNFIP